MLASPRIKTVKPPDKKPGTCSDRSSLLHRRVVKFQFVWQKLCYNISLGGPKILRVFAQDVPYGSIMKAYANDDLSSTQQCRQLKLDPLSAQVNIYCLMTNQTPALLVQSAS